MATETAPTQNERLKKFLHALLFVARFSWVFIVGWGGSITVLGQLFVAYKRFIAQPGGIVVIMWGLATLEVTCIPWFYTDTRAQYSGQRGTYGGTGSLLFAAEEQLHEPGTHTTAPSSVMLPQ